MAYCSFLPIHSMIIKATTTIKMGILFVPLSKYGILKMEVEKILKLNSEFDFMNASQTNYGKGATLVQVK